MNDEHRSQLDRRILPRGEWNERRLEQRPRRKIRLIGMAVVLSVFGTLSAFALLLR